jgi:hypothetical protein
MSVWFDDPQVLSKNLLSFWPNDKQDVNERVNATTRFIIYISVILFVIQKDSRVFVLGGVALGVLYAFYTSGIMVNPTMRPAQADGRVHPSLGRTVCEAPTKNNPMANVLISDYTEYPDRPGACYYPKVQNEIAHILDDPGIPIAPQDRVDGYRGTFGLSRLNSMPATTIPNDQTGFAQAAWGVQTGAQGCRMAPGLCSPNARGVQGEALGGLDSLGQNQPRSGF